jgi:mannosyltransferase OCH1-like enzyme
MFDTKMLPPTPAFLENRLPLPRQMQRFLPAIIGCIILLFIASTCSFSDAFTQPELRHVSKSSHIPKKIWQSWKVDVLNLEDRERDRARSWINKNPEYRYEVLTDGNDVHYVETHYGSEGLNRPDIVYFYQQVRAKIVRADLLRYLIMYAEGGVYADIDVEALRPINRFIPDRFNERDVDMVIGIEIDEPEWKSHPILGQKCMSFCQWTFACKPRLPVMLKLVEHIMAWMTDHAQRQNVPISDVQLDFDDIIAGTGPSAFTNALLDDISYRYGRDVNWDMFHNMAESKLIAGVLVLTVEAFAAGQGHSDSGNHEARNALVKHHYHASGWPKEHPRFNHPVYGEVEDCNWNDECVRKWDENTAAFDALSPEDQAFKIAVKKEKDKEREEEEKRDED